MTSGRASRHFAVGIRAWHDTEVATGLDLIRKMETLEMSNQAVAKSSHEENNYVETTELKIQELNKTSVPASDQKEKDKIIKNSSFDHVKLEVEDSKDDLQLDDPSRKFILYDLGLPGSSFINSDLEFQSNMDFVSDNIIEFWKNTR